MTDPTVLTRLLHAIDTLDWPTVRACLADPIHIDYSSLFGGSPETLPADTLVARWQALLPGFDATHHLTGPILATNNRLETHVTAHHWLAPDTWTVYGHYTAEVTAGKIAALTLKLHHQDGNLDLPNTATNRAKTSPRSR